MAPARLIILILVSIMLLLSCQGEPLTFPKRKPELPKCPPGYRPVSTGGCRKIITS